MSDRAQRVLDALMEYDSKHKFKFPIQAISCFFDNENIVLVDDGNIDEDYEVLTVGEEKQVIQAFLEFAY